MLTVGVGVTVVKGAHLIKAKMQFKSIIWIAIMYILFKCHVFLVLFDLVVLNKKMVLT